MKTKISKAKQATLNSSKKKDNISQEIITEFDKDEYQTLSERNENKPTVDEEKNQDIIYENKDDAFYVSTYDLKKNHMTGTVSSIPSQKNTIYQ